MGTPVTLKGENGAEFDVVLPPLGTHSREQYDSFIASGRLEVVAGTYPPETEAEDDGSDGGQQRPKVRDAVEAWRAYALAPNPVDGPDGRDPDEVAGMSKEDLIKRYGAKET